MVRLSVYLTGGQTVRVEVDEEQAQQLFATWHVTRGENGTALFGGEDGGPYTGAFRFSAIAAIMRESDAAQ